MFVKAIESVGVIVGIMSVGHCWRVAKITTAIGQYLEIEDQDFDDLYYGAVLHDIGILEQQEDEYLKQGLSFDGNFSKSLIGLSYDDGYDAWGNIRSHPVVGANMVENITLLSGAAPIIRHHHENYDGTGYPDGLKADEIPLGARIVAIAEVYEQTLFNTCFGGKTKSPVAFDSHNNSQKATEVEEAARQKIKESAGTILDPLLVDIFLLCE